MTPTTETWLPVVGYEGLYEVSDLGRVRSLDRTVIDSLGRRQTWPGQMMGQSPDENGRLLIGLSRRGRRTHVMIHTLVLTAFVGPRPEDMVACHGNGVPTDNRVTNLRWDTPSANAHDSVRHGTHHGARKTHCRWGHLLAAPNLSPRSKTPEKRICKACMRANVIWRRARERGEIADRRAIADHQYHQLMQLVDACP